MIKDLLEYRHYIWQNAVRDLRTRYSGTGLGFFWNVISPALQILVYGVVFSQIMPQHLHNASSSLGFVVYLCSGLLPWTAFIDAITRATGSFVENAAYLKKLPIPEPVFCATAVVSSALNLCITLALLVLLAAASGLPVGWAWFLLPVVSALWMLLAFGVGLILGTLNVFIRDISQILPVISQVWMWSVPVVYMVDILPARYQAVLIYNPPYAYLQSIHDILISAQPPSPTLWAMMLLWPTLAMAAGSLVLRSLRLEIRDVI